MADVKISQLPAATTPVDGTEVLPIVQSATTKQVSIANLTAGRAMAASSLTLTTPLAVTSGGTGLATVAQGALLSATAADTISATRTPTLGLAGTAAGTLGLSGSTSGVVTLQTAAAAGTWSMTLPTSGGTNGYILTTNGAGVTSWTNPTALGVDLDVGGTAITGGTSGRVLYDNAGVLGEYAVTGTGSVVLGTTPTFTTSALFPAGTVGAPGISVSGDTNTGIYFPAADTIGFVEGGVEAMRLDASGNLGLGVTPSAWGSNFKSLEMGNAGYGITSAISSGYVYTVQNAYQNGTNWVYKNNGTASRLDVQSNGFIWNLAASGSAGGTISFNQAMTLDASGNLSLRQPVSGTTDLNFQNIYGTTISRIRYDDSSGELLIGSVGGGYATRFVINGTERARIDSSGNLLVGATSVASGGRISAYASSNSTRAVSAVNTNSGDASIAPLYVSKFDNDSTTANVFVQFAINNQSSGSGQINANGANTAAFGSYSDKRLKENIAALPSQLANILALKPSEFDYRDGSGHQIGFIAQEMQEVYPDVVGEGDNGMLTITGWSKTEARLVSAIQELAAKVTALEAANG